MDMMPTTMIQYYYQTEKFGNDTHYCVYKKVILKAEYGEYSYQEWVETFCDEWEAQALVERMMRDEAGNS